MANETVKVYWHAPEPIFAARVNAPGTINYPIADIPYDGVTTGAYTDTHADMLVTFGSAAGLDDYGRARLRQQPTAGVLKIGRSSQGTEDGQVEIVDNAYISVFPDYRVWSKIPVIGPAPNYTELKDTDIPVSDRTEEPPPIANLGSDFAGSIDPSTETLTVFFVGSNSMAVADLATIASYAWEAPGGTFVNGTSATDADVYIEFGAGAHWVRLTVTDSNGKTNTGHRFVLADDPANSLCVSGMQVQSITRNQQGSTARLRVLQDLARADYPDGAKVLIWEDRPSLDGVSRDHMLFVGWHQTDQASSQALETHLRRETQLTCVDVAGRLDSLPGFAQRVEVPTAAEILEGLTWGQMPTANMDKFLHYLIQWHSTAAQVADFYPSGTWDAYPFVIFDSGGATLYEQLQRQANRIVPDYNFTCDRFGALRVVADPILQNTADRTATIQNSLTENAWSEIDFGYQRPPRVHTLRGSALLTQTAWEIDGDGEKQLLTPVFAIAPGTAPGQGGREQTLGERLAQSQEDLNDCVGHHYARLNARYGNINVALNLNADPWDFDPAAHTWVQLIVSAASAPYRGIDFANPRCLCKEVSIDYSYSEEAVTWRGRVTLELETVGLPALTEEQEEALPVGQTPAAWTVPEFGDPSLYSGEMQGYVFWDGAHVFRTANLHDVYPIWELIDDGIDGNVMDCQYVVVGEDTIGAWLMTSTAIWWCADIQATAPIWTEVLAIETVRAADAVPTTGDVVFKCMFHYWSAPGHLCVATGPLAGDSDNTTYAHAYFWVTEDYGASFTQVDMNSFLYGGTRGFCYSSLYAMNIYRSSPGTIYCIRSAPQSGLNSKTQVFLSSDLGYTWTEGEVLHEGSSTNLQVYSLLNPFPDATDPLYVVQGNIGVSNRPDLLVSTDGGVNFSAITDPSGYGGFSNLWRPNKRTFDNLHILAWARHSTENQMHLLESNDGGTTWSLLYDAGADDTTIDNVGTGGAGGNVVNAATHNTPNGWPPDVDQWVMIRAAAGTLLQRVILTLDNFSTFLDKTGNLADVVASWQEGPADGFALPKIGVNADAPPAVVIPGDGIGAYDAVTDIYALYGLRQMLTAYAGDFVRIRRESDDVEQDFGGDANGHLDTAAIATFLGLSAGYVVTLYDQSGNGHHATTATEANQPTVVLGSQNGLPALVFSNSFLVTSAAVPATGANARTIVAALRPTSFAGTFQHVAHYGNASSGQAFGLTVRTNNASNLGNHFWSTYHQGATTLTAVPLVAATTYDGTVSRLYRNGAQEGSNSTIALNTGSTFKLGIGSRINGKAETANFHLFELAVLSDFAALDTIAVQGIMNDYWQIY